MNDDQTEARRAFLRDADLALTTRRVKTRPDGLMKGEHYHHWDCSLHRVVDGTHRAIQFYYSAVLGCGEAPPRLGDVLETVRADASCGGYPSFEAFCEEFGYDPDSRAAEGIFNACNKLRVDLIYLFGIALFERFEQITEFYEPV